MNKCIACDKEINNITANEYNKCFHCNSYIYISDSSSEADNKQYFNTIYKLFEDIKESSEKKKIYRRYFRKDKLLRRFEYSNYRKHNKKIKKLFYNKTVLEIGFGEGKHLYSLLKNGIDAYGIEISDTAIGNFKNNYPKFKNRVFFNNEFKKKIDVVYCCALLEHIDDKEIIINIMSLLNENGIFIIDGLPTLNNKNATLSIDNDIVFWKPYHSVIYSYAGIINLFKKNKFKLLFYGAFDSYNYRVLSLHIKYGFKDIIRIRNSFIQSYKMPDLQVFKKICKEALGIKSLGLYGIYVFKKG